MAACWLNIATKICRYFGCSAASQIHSQLGYIDVGYRYSCLGSGSRRRCSRLWRNTLIKCLRLLVTTNCVTLVGKVMRSVVSVRQFLRQPVFPPYLLNTLIFDLDCCMCMGHDIYHIACRRLEVKVEIGESQRLMQNVCATRVSTGLLIAVAS